MSNELARFASLVTEHEGILGGRRSVAHLIKTVDGGATWTTVELNTVDDLRAVVAAMNRDVEERAVAAMRNAIDEGHTP